jgi:branched-subunit amino acid aminotransferase/4-amino-4-deoxychorismate lyase
MTTPLVYLSGRYLPQDEARLPLHDAGLVWGATITDLCRTFRHRLFRFDDHLARFRASCDRARVPLSLCEEELTAIANRLIEHNAALIDESNDLALVMLATPGPIGHYLGQIGQGPPTVAMHTFPLPFERYRRLFDKGACLVVPPTRHVPARSVDPRIKQRSRLFWWIAEQEAHDIDPEASALLLDIDGFVTETAAANLLLVQGGRVMTPWRGRVLGGVSLLVAEELCRELAIPFDEADVSLDDCHEADEAILTNTVYCLAPVRRIHDRELTCPGPVFERLLATWNEHVGLDLREQIKRPMRERGE